MDDSELRIPEAIAPEVFALAARLYAQNTQDYSLVELKQAGIEAQIPPEFIQQAVQEIQAQRFQAQKRQKQFKLGLAGLGVAIALWGVWAYNSFSSAAQSVSARWAQVENQFQRRADLIPNLVSVTQAYAKQEQDLARLLLQSRQSYLQAQTPAEKTEAIAEVSQAVDRFRDYAAKNPQLQSSQAFINLQYELVGTENRLAVERMRYNQAVQAYNQKIQQFPNALIAPVFGFRSQPFFQANTTSAPSVTDTVLPGATTK
jgi:LemA protein